MSPFSRLLLSTTAFIGLSAASAFAQGVVELDTVVVEGSGGAPAGSAAAAAIAGTGPVEGYVARQTTTGSKTTAPLIEVPQSISVITRDQIEDRAVKTVDQALNYSAGVFAQPFGTDNRFIAPIIRGFAASNNIFLDSFRFGRDFGALAFEQYGLERVEVVRGPASVLYGNAAPGGIVNLVTKRPTFTEFGEVGLSYGTNDRLEGTFDMGGVANEMISYRLTGLARGSKAQQDTLDDDRLYLAPSVTIAPDEDTSLTILSRLQYDKAGSPFGLPQAGTLDDNPFGIVPIDRYLGEPGFDDSDSLFGSLGYEFRHRFADDWEFRQNAQAVALDFDYQNLYFSSLGADMRTVNRGASIQTEDYKQYGIDNQIEGNFTTGVLEHDLLMGLDYRYISNRRTALFDFSVEQTDLFDPVYGQAITVDPGSSFSNINATSSQAGLYAQDQIRYGNAILSLGLRHDWAEIDYRADSGEDQSDDAFTGRAGLSYLFDNGIAPYVSYSTSFDPQIGTTTAGETFRPSEGEQFEVGVKFQPQGYDSFITLSAFDLTRTNVSGNTAQLVDGELRSVTTQTGQVNSRGLEIEAVASLAQGLNLIGSYSYTDAEIEQGVDTVVAGVVTATTTGNTAAQAPEHLASLWLDYAFQPGTTLEGLSLGGGARYIGSRFGNDANTIDLPSVTLFDAAIRYEKDAFKAALNVNNIADERYVASCNFGCFYGEGRSVIASVGYKW
ncbi:TonB-dependent siderophore receptor [Aureimonas populi]|uniref:TonB-dependent siderophore receptor n=1 Tax=Aureimonas populi TaxID=1701758 RepID=A0ABW5CNC2_9HYPH|nr:TonB-dependent siderophore receptor [Aureimonas populi]